MKKSIGGIALGLLAISFLPIVLNSCLNSDNDNDPSVRLLEEIQTIDNYLAANNITAVKDKTGIRMQITKLGTGFPSGQKSTINVDYVGKLFTTGAVFDDGNTELPITSYIDGWQFAFTTLPAGSKATLYIPSIYGYASDEKPGIPANSILIFDVEFKKVIKTATENQRLASDTVAIDTYLDNKFIDAVKDTTGVRYVISQVGTGATPTWYDKLKFKSAYKLLTDDTKIVAQVDREYGDSFDNRVVDQIADGVKLGLQRMPAGSKAIVYIPSGLAFGTSGAKDSQGVVVIPANANIIVEIELLEVTQ